MDKIWNQIHSSGAWGAYPSEHVVRFVARNYYQVPRRDEIRILDFGCGQGAHTWFLAREGFDTYAFDGSENAVRKAEERLGRDGLRATFAVADGCSINYPENFFDAVIDNVCIYANERKNIQTMYQNVYRVLKWGGRILSVCFGEELDGYQSGTEIEPRTYDGIREGVLKDRGISHIFTEKEFIDMLGQTGFQDVSCDWIRYRDGGYLVHQYLGYAMKKE